MVSPSSLTNRSPIFILGCDRSGSSLLRYIVDTHPDIASPAELNLGEICHLLYQAATQTLGNTTLAARHNLSVEELVLQEVRASVGQMMAKYTQAKGKSIWCEKSPRNLLYLEAIAAVFPTARYICLHRHAMDVVHSCLEASRWSFMPDQLNYVCQNSGSIVGAMTQNWVEKTRSLIAFEADNPSQCFRLKYESYVSQPYSTLKPMFEFLGVVWQPETIDRIFTTQHDLGPQDPKVAFSKRIHKKSIGKGTKVSHRYIPKHLLEPMNQLLAELDYPIVDSSWGKSVWPTANLLASKIATDRATIAEGNVRDALLQSLGLRLPQLAENFKERRVVYQIQISGENPSNWLLDIDGTQTQIVPLEKHPLLHVDCTVSLAEHDISGMISGDSNPIEMLADGTLQIEGDAELAEIFCWFLCDRLAQREARSSWWLQDYLGH